MSRDLKLITLALFLWGGGEGLFIYIMPLYMEQLGATPQAAPTDFIAMASTSNVIIETVDD